MLIKDRPCLYLTSKRVESSSSSFSSLSGAISTRSAGVVMMSYFLVFLIRLPDLWGRGRRQKKNNRKKELDVVKTETFTHLGPSCNWRTWQECALLLCQQRPEQLIVTLQPQQSANPIIGEAAKNMRVTKKPGCQKYFSQWQLLD